MLLIIMIIIMIINDNYYYYYYYFGYLFIIIFNFQIAVPGLRKGARSAHLARPSIQPIDFQQNLMLNAAPYSRLMEGSSVNLRRIDGVHDGFCFCRFYRFCRCWLWHWLLP